MSGGTVLLVVPAFKSRGPTALYGNSPFGGFADELFSRLNRRERGRVEPPTDLAEIALHVGFELVIAVELEPLLGISRRVSVLARLDAGGESDEPHRSRRQECE